MRKFPYYIITALALTACSESDMPWEADVPNEEYPDVVVPIELVIGSDWSVSFDDDTRGAPPDAIENTAWQPDYDNDCETLSHVRIITFRRPDIDTQEGENPYPWTYDVTNDHEVSIDGYADSSDHDLGSHRHRTAKSNIIKQYGFEYRVIALAYSTTCENPYYTMSQHTFQHEGPNNKLYTTYNCGSLCNNISQLCGGYTTGDLGSLVIEPGTTLEEFHAEIRNVVIASGSGSIWQEYHNGASVVNSNNLSINPITHQTRPLDGTAVRIPQLYWGFCHLKTDNDPVIKYRELIPATSTDDDATSTDDDATSTDDDATSTDDEATYKDNLPLTGILYRGVAKVRLEIETQERNDILWIALLGDNVFSHVDLNDYSCFNNAYEPISDRDKYSMVGGVAVHQTNSAEVNQKLVIDCFMLPARTRLAVRVAYDNGDIYNYRITAEADEINEPNTGTGIISPIYRVGEFYLRRNHYYHLKASTTARLLKNNSFN